MKPRRKKYILPQTGEMATLNEPHQLLKDLVYDVTLQERCVRISLSAPTMVVCSAFMRGQCYQSPLGATLSRRCRIDLNRGCNSIYTLPACAKRRAARFLQLVEHHRNSFGQVINDYIRSQKFARNKDSHTRLEFEKICDRAAVHRTNFVPYSIDPTAWKNYMLGLADILEPLFTQTPQPTNETLSSH